MTETKLHFVIGSDYARMRDVQGQLMDAVAAHGYDEQATFAIKLALEEALINAIKHGNKNHPDKTVDVEARVNGKRAEFVIHDQGQGFARTEVPDPTEQVNREKSSGRGLLLIEAYMSEVAYSDNGRRIKLVYKKK